MRQKTTRTDCWNCFTFRPTEKRVRRYKVQSSPNCEASSLSLLPAAHFGAKLRFSSARGTLSGTNSGLFTCLKFRVFTLQGPCSEYINISAKMVEKCQVLTWKRRNSSSLIFNLSESKMNVYKIKTLPILEKCELNFGIKFLQLKSWHSIPSSIFRWRGAVVTWRRCWTNLAVFLKKRGI